MLLTLHVVSGFDLPNWSRYVAEVKSSSASVFWIDTVVKVYDLAHRDRHSLEIAAAVDEVVAKHRSTGSSSITDAMRSCLITKARSLKHAGDDDSVRAAYQAVIDFNDSFGGGYVTNTARHELELFERQLKALD